MTKLININRLWLVFGFLMLASVLFSVSLSSAATRKPASAPQLNSKPAIVSGPTTPTSSAKPVSLADLFVKSIKIKTPLQEGDKIQGCVTIIIANQGTGASAACEVKIICGPVQVKGLATAFMRQMSQGQSVSIPGIQPGATAGIEWPGRTMETWRAGAYKITVEADSTKKVLESNEANNLGQAQFQVSEKTGVVRKEVPVKGGMPLAPPEAKTKPTVETSTGVGKRNITGVDFVSAPNTGTGKREIKGVDFTAAPNIGTGKREITGVDFTAAPNIGTGKREIAGVDFTAAPNTGTGKREITGVDFTAAPNTGTGKREIIGVDFTAASNIGTGKREITGVDFTAAPNTGTGKREIIGVDFTAAPNTGTGKREITGVDFTTAPNIGTGKREIAGVDFTAALNTGTGKREITGVDFTVGPSIGTGKRQITGVNFTVLPPVNN